MRLPSVTRLRLTGPVASCGPLRSCCHGNQMRSQVRSISHVVLTVDHRGHPARPLLCKPQTPSVLWPLTLQPCRAVSSVRPGWYESIADSGPVHLTEQLLVFSQQATGLPWWASIVCTTLALRTAVTLPLAVYQAIIMAKVEALQKEIAELARQLHYEVSVKAQEKGWSERTCRSHFKKNLRRIVSELYVRDNCHPFKTSVLIWVQLPMWVCVSLALRNLSLGTGHVSTGLQQELAAGGALWFSNLTLPDSTWIIPVSLGLTNLFITEVFALRQVQASRFQKNVTHFIRGLSLVMIPLAAAVPSVLENLLPCTFFKFFPANRLITHPFSVEEQENAYTLQDWRYSWTRRANSMALYWLSSSCVGLAHNLLLRSPRFRALCRIPPTRLDSETPYRDIVAAFVAKYIKLRT